MTLNTPGPTLSREMSSWVSQYQRRRASGGDCSVVFLKAASCDIKAGLYACAGISTLYVHVMAVNEIGRALYTSCGFVVEQEETANQAHYRGHCLDGIEGRGRTVLLRKALF
jgi:hypothetical protein